MMYKGLDTPRPRASLNEADHCIAIAIKELFRKEELLKVMTYTNGIYNQV
jgi:hypothetical protein